MIWYWNRYDMVNYSTIPMMNLLLCNGYDMVLDCYIYCRDQTEGTRNIRVLGRYVVRYGITVSFEVCSPSQCTYCSTELFNEAIIAKLLESTFCARSSIQRARILA